jgi:hypothetical protein
VICDVLNNVLLSIVNEPYARTWLDWLAVCKVQSFATMWLSFLLPLEKRVGSFTNVVFFSSIVAASVNNAVNELAVNEGVLVQNDSGSLFISVPDKLHIETSAKNYSVELNSSTVQTWLEIPASIPELLAAFDAHGKSYTSTNRAPDLYESEIGAHAVRT